MHTRCQLHTFQRHGQTTCLSHSSFLKAVCPAGTDSIWKTCLNESTHQLHQRILTSSLVCLSHISPFITSLHFLFSPFHHFSFVSWFFLLSMLLFCYFVIIKKSITGDFKMEYKSRVLAEFC